MSAVIFLGDELTATGFRIAGVEVVVATPQDAASALADARRRARFVLIGADLARHISAAGLDAAMLAPEPIVTVIADIRDTVAPTDLTRSLKTTLGIET